jgi:hypothetical protein
VITDGAVEIVAKELFASQLAIVNTLRAEDRPLYTSAIYDHVRLALELASLQSPPVAISAEKELTIEEAE